jgi:predicted amidophosphoribosyltransferase
VPQNLTEHYKKELHPCFLDVVLVGTPYSQIEKILERYKYFSNREYVDIFVDILSNIVEHAPKETVDISIVAVPMHWTRYFFRGFDHIAFLSKKFARKEGISYTKLLRTTSILHQV